MTPSKAFTYEEQLEVFRLRGLLVGDIPAALHSLSHLNYYRLKLYGEVFWDPAAGVYRPGTRFEDILEIYRFDQRLRGLVLGATKCVEVSVRSRLAYEIGHRQGALAHLDTMQYQKAEKGVELLWTLCAEIRRSKEDFILAARKSGYASDMPVWAAVEVASFGVVSKMFSGQRSAALRQAVADSYGVDEIVLVSALHHFNVLRNTAAHHGRLWNRHFSIELALPRKKPAGLFPVFSLGENRNRLYNSLVLLVYLVRKIDPASELPELIYRHLLTVPAGLVGQMGLPTDWASNRFWTTKVAD